MFAQVNDLQMIRTDDWKLNLYAGVPGELYDLNEDCGEFYNLVGASGSNQVVDDLQRQLVSHCSDGNDGT